MWSLGALALAAILALLQNRLASGRGAWSSPGLLGDLGALILSSQGLCLLLAAFCRPALAGLVVVGCALALRGLNAVKLRVLREPLVFSDLGLLPGVLQSPEFYFPHLPLWPVLGAALAALALLAGALWLEPPAASLDLPARLALAALSLLPALHLLLAARGFFPGFVDRVLAAHPLNFDPTADVTRYSLAGAFVLHLLSATAGAQSGGAGLPGADEGGRRTVWPGAALAPLTGRRPHMVLVQAESFCDLRRQVPGLDADLLANYDAAARQGQSGRFAVASFGAYTMRTEFAVLSGLPASFLGAAAFDPYLFAAARPAWSLARHLRAQGYATLCLHPNDGRFFRRSRVLPNLGFERFLDSDDFAGAERFGPYVSDEAVADRVLGVLSASAQPCFCFAITMEAHGPWLPGRLPDGEGGAGEPDSEPLALYAQHLRNADRMLGQLLAGFAHLDRPVVLGLYGDHVGSLPGLFVGPEARERWTDYLIWASSALGSGVRRDVLPEELGGLLLETVRSLGEPPHWA